jgi:ABC-type Fe3+-hydroxamate transport system substrate-binding protein
METLVDQMGREVAFEKMPERIISLVPSQTELLHDLGLGENVVGITKFCIHPKEWFESKPRVGGTKKVDFDKIAELKPDLIIANKEENEESDIIKLMEDYTVWVTDVKDIMGAFHMIQDLGQITGTYEKAHEMCGQIHQQVMNVRTEVHTMRKYNAAYLIWKDPYMVAGEDNFINKMLEMSNCFNVFNLPEDDFETLNDNKRYPEITPETLAAANPELILLSSEPFPFQEKHLEEFKTLCPNAIVKVVDGEMFSWYGSRLLQAPAYLKSLIYELEEIVGSTLK